MTEHQVEYSEIMMIMIHCLRQVKLSCLAGFKLQMFPARRIPGPQPGHRARPGRHALLFFFLHLFLSSLSLLRRLPSESVFGGPARLPDSRLCLRRIVYWF
jgi:hypothetical protein